MTTHPASAWRFARVACILFAAFGALNLSAAVHALPQENGNRPPWAQKPKKGNPSNVSIPATVAGDSDPAQDRAKIKVKVDLVNVLVSVLDEHNRPAPDLPVEAFQLQDEDNPQKIAVFEKETQLPLDLALMFDASLSVQLGMPAQREAANRFIQQVLRPGDHMALYAVDENVTQIATFTESIAHLQDSLKRIPQGAGTSIYDAVYLGSRALARQGAERRRVIILITDGGETTSRADFDAARQEAVRASALLYTILLRAVKNENGRNTAGEHALETLTDTTGGAVFYPDSTAQLDPIFAQINRELRTQYRLGYYPHPKGPADSYRHIEVSVAAAPASPADAVTPETQASAHTYTVRHRKTYYTGLP
jgi:Ca-activated chloride channel family protein